MGCWLFVLKSWTKASGNPSILCAGASNFRRAHLGAAHAWWRQTHSWNSIDSLGMEGDKLILTIWLILFYSRQLVHRTEVAENTKNPEWKPFGITVKRLCGAEKERFNFLD
jgi:hypothetical protein